MVKITKEWDELLETEFNTKGYKLLREFLKEEYSTQTVYPSMYDIFNSMKITSFDQIKVVLLGQDPYHNQGQAMGLSFSVPKGMDKPPSLVNIFKELKAETAIRVLDMLSGAIYALDGGVYEMEQNIFMFAPNGVEMI